MALRLSFGGGGGGGGGGAPSPRSGGRGLGDLLKRVSTALGINPCGGCDGRAAALNKLSTGLSFGKKK